MKKPALTGQIFSKELHCAAPQGCLVWQSYNVAAEMLSLVPGIIYVYNHQTRSNEYSNHSIAGLLGYSPEEILEMGDEMLLRVIDPEHHAGLFRYFEKLHKLRVGERCEWEYLTRAKDGRRVWLHSVDAALECDATGRVLRHIGIATDITLVKEAELRLQDMNHHLEDRVEARTRALAMLNAELEERVASRTADLSEINAELSELAYVATHDLKVPVANMCSLASSLSDARSDISKDHHDTLDWLAESGEQARATLDALVQVAVTRDASAETEQSFSLPGVIEDVLVPLTPRLLAIGGEVSVTTGDITELTFAPKALKTALHTVLINAINYADTARPLRIAIRAARTSGQVFLSVEDNGRGIDSEKDRVKVFGLFKRAQAEPSGLGIGLYCAQLALRKHGASIDFSGVPGRGAIFTMALPDKGARNDTQA